MRNSFKIMTALALGLFAMQVISIALDYENLHKNIADVVEKARARDVKHLLAIGVTLSRFEQAYESLREFNNVSLACGVHPLDFEEEPL
ncbi:TatD family hydrolase [Haemophilus influenzae]